jgi:hypothetical protein
MQATYGSFYVEDRSGRGGAWTAEDAQRLAGNVGAVRHGRTAHAPHVLTPSGPFFVGTLGAEKCSSPAAARRRRRRGRRRARSLRTKGGSEGGEGGDMAIDDDERSPRWALDEAVLQREVLLAVGRYQRQRPTAFLLPNPVGQGYAHVARNAVAAALAPFGRAAVEAAMQALSRHVLRYGDVGSPDLTGWVDGRWVGLELKREGGRDAEGRRVAPGVVEPHQEQWHEAARRRGAFVAVVRRPDEVAAVLERARGGGDR